MLLPDSNGATICVDYSLLIRVLVGSGFPCLRRNYSGQKLLQYRQIEFNQWINCRCKSGLVMSANQQLGDLHHHYERLMAVRG